MAETVYLHRSGRRYGRNRLLAVCLLLLWSACKPASENIRILFVGDVLLSRNVKQELQSCQTSPWDSLRSLFESADLVIGNLEGAVGAMPNTPGHPADAPLFAIDSADVGLLKQAGFSAMTVENNHSFDCGATGKQVTDKQLLDSSVCPVGLDNSPYFFNIKGRTIALVAINTIASRDYSKCEIPSVAVSQKLRLAKTLANIVIVSIHWGSELLDWPNKRQYDAAKWLISEGADIIIGHHPHVIQQPELIDGKPVYFSLGNHLFDQKYAATKQGLIAEIELKDGEFDCKGRQTQTSKNSFYPRLKGRQITYFSGIGYRRESFTVNSYQIIPQSIDGMAKTMLKAYQNNRLIWRSYPLSLVTLQKTKIDGETEHLFALQRYYSSIDNEINLRPYVYAVDQRGLVARWRGSALAWPILDAQISPSNDQILSALHRGDSFIRLGEQVRDPKSANYQWNGFGFSLITDTTDNK